MRSGITVDELKEEMLTYLGHSGIMVELQSNDLTTALKSAVRKYNRWAPMRARAVQQVSASQRKYGPLQTRDGHSRMKGVVRVEFLDPRTVESEGLDPFDPFSYFTPSGYTIAGMTFGELMQTYQYREVAARLVDAEPEWLGQWEGQNYYLYIDAPTPVICSYEFTWGLSVDDDASTGMGLLPDGDIEWVVEYATAKAKTILGRIRGKFMGIPGPEGDLQIDADTLLQEARDDMQRLEEELRRRRRPFLPELE
jgi:hypothetical protein